MKLKKGFTLAEVLLTLAVIGIVAAITLPSLLVDTTEKAFDAQKRALHARLAQAIGMMSSLNGYGQYVAEVKADDGSVTTPGKDDAAETFLYEGLSKVYKINNICDSDNLDKCGIPSSFTTMAGGTMNFPKKLSELNPLLIRKTNGIFGGNQSDLQLTDTKAAAFETVNGESIAVFYNPNCKNDLEIGSNINNSDPDNPGDWFYVQSRMCVNFVYDLNGLKGPNKVGRDIGFITALYAKNPEVVAPVPFEENLEGTYTQQDAVEACINYSDDSRLPNKHEASSLFYNRDIIGNVLNQEYWTSSVAANNLGWNQGNGGGRGRGVRTYKRYARCIKK